MYGISLELLKHQTKEESNSEGLRAYAWINDSTGDFARIRELDLFIKNNIIKRDDGIAVDDVRDMLMDMLLHNDYKDDKAMNYEYGCKKSIKSFIYDTAKYAYKRLKHPKMQYVVNLVHLEDFVTSHTGKDSASDESMTYEDRMPDKKAESAFDNIVLTKADEVIDKMIRVNNTLYDGFIPLIAVKCLCREEDVAECRLNVMNILGVRPVGREIFLSEDFEEIMSDMKAFDDSVIIESIVRKVPSGEQLVNLVRTVNMQIRRNKAASATNS